MVHRGAAMLRRTMGSMALILSLTLPGVGAAQPRPPRTSASQPDQAAIRQLLSRTAHAQVARLQAEPLHIPPGNWRGVSVNWISATFLIGLGRFAQDSGEEDLRQYLRQVAEHYNFGLQGGWNARSILDADDIAIGEVYQQLYARSGQVGEIAPLRTRLDANIGALERSPAPEKLVWWWCDALFMAPPVFARMSAQTGDPRYLRAADIQWWRTYDRLWSAQHRLFWRDQRFPDRLTRNGRPVVWSRGNGWVVAGLARLLESMPADFPSRPRYVALFRTMMDSIARHQRREDGLWTASLLDAQDPAGPETTGSAFFTYAMAWGINHGILDRGPWLPRVKRAWSGLAASIQPNGLLGFAQRAGDQPEPARAQDHALYGTGGLLLAGVEMLHLAQAPTPLPLAEPPRDAPGPLRMPIRLRPRPEGGSAEELHGWERAMAERQAMIDLGYDPEADVAR